MFETTQDVKDALREAGEMMVVLDSDREYALHPHDTRFEGGVVVTEGIEDGHEYLTVKFPPEAVEHYYTHAEL